MSVKARINWSVEAPRVKELSIQGYTLQEIGDLYGVSRARIGQVVQKYYPTLASEDRGISVEARRKREVFLGKRLLRTGRLEGQHKDDLSRAMASAFSRKKQNSKNKKWEWSITPRDITFSLVCPMLGIELDWFAEYRAENSPSFDRIDNTKGYVPGNVIVCSWRANRIKNDGTAIEHAKIAAFLERQSLPTS